MIVGWLVALLIQSASGDWARDLTDKDWTRIGFDTERTTLHFMKAGPDATRVWWRQELQSVDEYGAHSQIALIEYDCVGGRTRQLEGASYPLPDLQGAPSPWTQLAAWSYPMQGSVSAEFFSRVCTDEIGPSADLKN